MAPCPALLTEGKAPDISLTVNRREEIPLDTRLHRAGKNMTQTCSLSENLLSKDWAILKVIGDLVITHTFDATLHEIRARKYVVGMIEL